MNTEYWIYELDEKDNIDDDIKYNFVFELCWRLDKMLYPFDEKIVNLLLSCIKEEYCSEKNILLSVYLLKYYRQNGLTEEWSNLYSKLAKNDLISDSLKGELDYENSLQSLFHLDYPQLKKITSNWKYPNNTPFENAKKEYIRLLLGAVMAVFRLLKQRDIIKLLPAVVFMGAAVLHLIFPADSSYVMKYYLLLLPAVSFGYCSFFENHWEKQDMAQKNVGN